MSTEAREAKKALRKDIKQRLATHDDKDVAAQSLKAQQTVLSLPQYKAAKRISIYLSMPTGEAQTNGLVRDALLSGKQVFVPHVHSLPAGTGTGGSESAKRKKTMDMLRLRSFEEFENLHRDAWGIPCLSTDSIATRENAMGGFGITGSDDTSGTSEAENEVRSGLDMTVVPGVAFDAHMNRTGHGAGFYDSFLSRLCADGKRKKPFLVGFCLAEQVLPTGRLVMQNWDQKVDAVAVGDGRFLTS